MTARARLGVGEVRHERRTPVVHRFAYPTTFLLLPMRSLRTRPDPALARNRRALFGFRDRDHGDGRDDSLAWFEALLAREGVHDADGEVWLHCFPRMLGVAFKPVSFWYAHRADGSLAAVLAEVHNTFGERHGYLLKPPGLAFGAELVARKTFHVSPFCPVQGEYRFRFVRSDLGAAASAAGAGDAPGDAPFLGRTAVRIEWWDDPAADGPALVTSVSGALQPLTRSAARQALWRSPLMTVAIVARIHWQALALWRRRLAVFSLPPAPASPVTHGGRAHFRDPPRIDAA